VRPEISGQRSEVSGQGFALFAPFCLDDLSLAPRRRIGYKATAIPPKRWVNPMLGWENYRMNRFMIVAVLAVTVAYLSARAIEEDGKHFGPMDGHAVRVFEVLDKMDLSIETKSKCRGIAEHSQQSWREWYLRNQPKVEAFEERIQKLKVDGTKDELKTAQAEKKKFMHTAPSLLRNPAPIQEVLTEKERADFLARLNDLTTALHNPKKK
jgi:hypothetical protein